MSEETLWTRAYGDEYWADVTSPLFFSLVGEYLTEYVNHEGARIMGYREIADNCVCGSLGAHTHTKRLLFSCMDRGRTRSPAPS